jgi:hypothetical protein
MGKPSRDKGSRVEREMVNALRAEGIDAERVPLSGAAGGSFAGDIVVRHHEAKRSVEVKARKDGAGFKTLEDWKGDHDFLFLKRNHREPMVVMDWDLFVELMRSGG